MLDFVETDENGESILCYRPRRFFAGFDQFSYEVIDWGFPWGCAGYTFADSPGCYAGKLSPAAFINIQVFEIP